MNAESAPKGAPDVRHDQTSVPDRADHARTCWPGNRCPEHHIDVDPAPISDLIAVLRDSDDAITRDHVSRLMAYAWKCGYDFREYQENAAYPPAPVFTAGRWMDQVDARRRHDAEARKPRPDDFQGHQ